MKESGRIYGFRGRFTAKYPEIVCQLKASPFLSEDLERRDPSWKNSVRNHPLKACENRSGGSM